MTAILGSTLMAAVVGQCSPDWIAPDPAFRTNPNGVVHALVVHDADGGGPLPAQMYASGQFTLAGGVPVGHVARWDGRQWHGLGMGADNNVYAMASFDPDGPGPSPPVLAAGGWLTSAGGVPAKLIAAWNGTSWSALGPGLTGSRVRAMIVFDGDGPGPAPAELIVGGNFTHAGEIEVNSIARWNGSSWAALGAGVGGGGPVFVDPFVHAMAVYDADGGGPGPAKLVVTGSFTRAGGAEASYVAAWDGSSWQPLGGGVTATNGDVRGYALTVLPAGALGGDTPRLVLGGLFEFAGGVPSRNLAVWDGAQWASIGDADSAVLALTTFDPDKAGPAPMELVAAGGGFTTIGGVAADGIARWDGHAWRPMSVRGGQNGDVLAMLGVDPDASAPAREELVVGGLVTLAGGLPVANLARWGCAPACPADCTGDGGLDVADFTCFQNAYALGDKSKADVGGLIGCGADGVLTILDFACFQNHFALGCP